MRQRGTTQPNPMSALAFGHDKSSDGWETVNGKGVVTEAPHSCSRCGHVMGAEMAYCPSCGSSRSRISRRRRRRRRVTSLPARLGLSRQAILIAALLAILAGLSASFSCRPGPPPM